MYYICGAPVVAVRMICSRAEPTTMNKKNPSSMGPTVYLFAVLSVGWVPDVPRLVTWGGELCQPGGEEGKKALRVLHG
jgi:hypothetical protein